MLKIYSVLKTVGFWGFFLRVDSGETKDIFERTDSTQ